MKVEWLFGASVFFLVNFFWKVAIFCMRLEVFAEFLTVSVSSLVSEEVASF